HRPPRNPPRDTGRRSTSSRNGAPHTVTCTRSTWLKKRRDATPIAGTCCASRRALGAASRFASERYVRRSKRVHHGSVCGGGAGAPDTYCGRAIAASVGFACSLMLGQV